MSLAKTYYEEIKDTKPRTIEYLAYIVDKGEPVTVTELADAFEIDSQSSSAIMATWARKLIDGKRVLIPVEGVNTAICTLNSELNKDALMEAIRLHEQASVPIYK